MTHYTIPRQQETEFETWCGDNGIAIRREPWSAPWFHPSRPSLCMIRNWLPVYVISPTDEQKLLLKLSWDDLWTISDETAYTLNFVHENNVKMMQQIMQVTRP